MSKANLVLAVVLPLATRLRQTDLQKAGLQARGGRKARSAVKPPRPAFAIWAPLFAINIGHAALRATRDRRRDPAFRRLGWLTSAAYAFNIAWGVHAEIGSRGWRSVLLVGASAATSVAAATAASAYAHEARRKPGREAQLVANAIAPVAGWVTVATFTNVEDALDTAPRRPAHAVQTRRAVGLVAAAGATAAAGAYALRGNLLYSGGAACALAGVVAKNHLHRTAVSRAAGIGLLALAGATWLGRRRG